MPRKARIDAPGALHHIIVRGIERRRIFSDDQDRQTSDQSQSTQLIVLLGGKKVRIQCH